MLEILIVEDNLALQKALRAGLEATGEVRVLAGCERGEDALPLCLAHPPQAVLMDVHLAGELNGIQAAVALRREFPRLPVVFYSIQDDDAYYRDFRRSGILSHYAYVRKSNYLLPEMILPLLRDAVAGRSFIDPEIEARVQEVRRKDEQSPLALLEPNEQVVARLIGAPPGYVGYEEGGYLTEAVRRKPYSVLLLDEVEKAHPDVFNVLLQVLDDGRLTDGQGRTVDFKNTVIVMTSNIGSHLIQAMVGQDSQDIKDAVWGELKNHFRPEFLNRIDETVVFHALDAQHIASIAKIQLKLLETRLAKMDLELQVSDAALAELAKVGFDPVFGARPLKRAIQQRIENPLSKLLLEGRFAPKSVIPVTVNPVLEPGVFQFGVAPQQ